MDRPPSFTHYQNPNPIFFHHVPPPNPNPNFFFRTPPAHLKILTITPPTAPSPPPIRALSGTIHVVGNSENLRFSVALDHSSILQKDENGGFGSLPF
ncbi:hypothetical protein ISN44_As08g004300 [Arabidopsis suecica]|uniref:Uncharacterized protein n=1 Tax=Arabidopsis suecica TaxID=45249 RepID=A0A8T2B4Y4_ARASU|nr:hypothetical protein ISN44_As08g004300 [Arabidopsis suecica]